MYATLIAPCWVPALTPRSARTEEPMIRQQRTAEVRALLEEIAVSYPVGYHESSIDLPAELYQALDGWTARQTPQPRRGDSGSSSRL